MNSKYTDDAFVVTSTFDELRDSGYGRSERIARALSRAGAAITVTSCTNAFAFFMGSTTQISAMSMFAVWAGKIDIKNPLRLK